MKITQFFSDLLNLTEPFSIDSIEKVEENGKISHIEIIVQVNPSYRPVSKDGSLSSLHSHYERTWRHLNLFEYPCYIRCNVPRYKYCDGKIRTLEVPWSRKGSGFTLLFEAHLMTLLKLTHNVRSVAQMLGLYPQRVWAVFNHYMDSYEEERTLPQSDEIGIDETSSKKGHEYITLFVDMNSNEVLDVQDGKDSTAIKEFSENYPYSEEVKSISMDMSPAFIKGVKEHLPEANITFDKFHVVRLINKKLAPEKEDDSGIRIYLAELFNHIWIQESRQEAEAFLQFWTEFAFEKGFKSIAKSIKKHLYGIVEYVSTKLNNGKIEGINNKIQLIKRTARGYRYNQTFRKMIFLAFNHVI